MSEAGFNEIVTRIGALTMKTRAFVAAQIFVKETESQPAHSVKIGGPCLVDMGSQSINTEAMRFLLAARRLLKQQPDGSFRLDTMSLMREFEGTPDYKIELLREAEAQLERLDPNLDIDFDRPRGFTQNDATLISVLGLDNDDLGIMTTVNQIPVRELRRAVRRMITDEKLQILRVSGAILLNVTTFAVETAQQVAKPIRADAGWLSPTLIYRRPGLPGIV